MGSRPTGVSGQILRWPKFEAAIQKLDLGARREVLSSLDQVSRPMRPTELEKALRMTGAGDRNVKFLTTALAKFDIIMVRPK